MSRRRNNSSSASCCGVGCVFFFLFAFVGSLSSCHDSGQAVAPPPAVTAPAPAYMETPIVSTPITRPGSDTTSAAADHLSTDKTYHPEELVPPPAPPPDPEANYDTDQNSQNNGYVEPGYAAPSYVGPAYTGGTYVRGYYRHNRNGGTSYVRSHHRR